MIHAFNIFFARDFHLFLIGECDFSISRHCTVNDDMWSVHGFVSFLVCFFFGYKGHVALFSGQVCLVLQGGPACLKMVGAIFLTS